MLLPFCTGNVHPVFTDSIINVPRLSYKPEWDIKRISLFLHLILGECIDCLAGGDLAETDVCLSSPEWEADMRV